MGNPLEQNVHPQGPRAVDALTKRCYNTHTEQQGIKMKITGTRYIKERKDFGAVDNTKQLVVDPKIVAQLEAIVYGWIRNAA